MTLDDDFSNYRLTDETICCIDRLLQRSMELRERSMGLMDVSNQLIERCSGILQRSEDSQFRSSQMLDHTG